MRKKIALLIPHHFNIYEGIIKNLNSAGFDVEILVLTDTGFRYKNIWQQVNNFIQKSFLRNNRYKKDLRVNFYSDLLTKTLENHIGTVDYSMVIRPDYFSPQSLQLLKEKSKFIVGYQWDGFKRYPEVLKYIPLFDRFFTFDREDFENYKNVFANLKPTTNFYLDNVDIGQVKNEGTVFFLGSYLPNRIDDIIIIANYLKAENIKTSIQILYSHSKIPTKLANAPLTLRPEKANYMEMIQEIQKAECLLEFKNLDVHNGLSFRVFEAIAYKKKLITNDPHIRVFDFYHPENIFIWENNNLSGVKDFLSKKYVDIDQKIVEKYAFTNWIHYVLDIEPYEPINNI
ncbi:MAG: hypothetical protein ACOH1X_09715 [Kaistella sp.]